MSLQGLASVRELIGWLMCELGGLFVGWFVVCLSCCTSTPNSRTACLVGWLDGWSKLDHQGINRVLNKASSNQSTQKPNSKPTNQGNDPTKQQPAKQLDHKATNQVISQTTHQPSSNQAPTQTTEPKYQSTNQPTPIYQHTNHPSLLIHQSPTTTKEPTHQ